MAKPARISWTCMWKYIRIDIININYSINNQPNENVFRFVKFIYFANRFHFPYVYFPHFQYFAGGFVYYFRLAYIFAPSGVRLSTFEWNGTYPHFICNDFLFIGGNKKVIKAKSEKLRQRGKATGNSANFLYFLLNISYNNFIQAAVVIWMGYSTEMNSQNSLFK